jgi:hypothetical protein
MIKTAFKTGIGLFALVVLSACATQESPERLAAEGECLRTETLSCDKFADETYNCTCEKTHNLREMLDAYTMPDY